MSAVSSKPVPATSRRSNPSPTPPTSRSPSMRTSGTARAPVASTPVARRRPPAKNTTLVPPLNGETKETLSESLRQESAQKEQLLLQVQDKDTTIANLAAENSSLTSSLNAVETRLNELYAEQSRWEVETAQRIDIADKLREQVREHEKEKRDLQRRYNEQTSTFEAERQAFYDNEQHLKSRIQSLTQARKRAEAAATKAVEALAPTESRAQEFDDPTPLSERNISQKSSAPDSDDPDNEPAEMTALRLELSTLSTSYTSIQSTLVLLQSQLVDLKRVNQELQEENESYMILLREKTLSGQFDLMRQVGGDKSSEDEDDSEEDERGTSGDLTSIHSIGRNTLDRVEEEPESLPESGFDDLEAELSRSSSRNSKPSKPGRRRTTSTSAPRGESLANLPITGPGLDLAAELGRAENKDILDGTFVEPQEANKGKRTRKTSDGRKGSSAPEDGAPSDFESLRNEVKSLKDANKALSLYASKIIDRIIAQEGFEHVLAADYDSQPKTPSTLPAKGPPRASPAKPRPQSVFLAHTTASPAIPTTPTLASPATAKPQNHKRRSLSFDWKTFSFSSDKKSEPSPNLRPLTLQPGASPVVTSARKLETYEDEEDRKERERLTATMKLMGIQPQPSIHSPGLVSRTQSENSGVFNSPSAASSTRRFSLLGSRPSGENSDANSIHSTRSMDAARPHGLGLSSVDLTHEALEHAQAENSLAALDAREKNLSQEIAKGGTGGFTEVQRRAGRRSRLSAGGSGSGSTVFSAGMADD